MHFLAIVNEVQFYDAVEDINSDDEMETEDEKCMNENKAEILVKKNKLTQIFQRKTKMRNQQVLLQFTSSLGLFQ